MFIDRSSRKTVIDLKCTQPNVIPLSHKVYVGTTLVGHLGKSHYYSTYYTMRNVYKYMSPNQHMRMCNCNLIKFHQIV